MKSKKKVLLTGSTSFLGSKFFEMYSTHFEILGVSLSDPDNPVDILNYDILFETISKFQPNVVVHFAAVVDNDVSKVREPNIQGTKNIVQIAKEYNIPIVYMSSEAVYGGREDTGNYSESDEYKPRSIYGETKVESEKVILESGLNYLILRGHRFVGISRRFNKAKQFPDTLKAILNHQIVHLDSIKLFKPCLINHLSEIIEHYISNDMDKKVIMNVGVDKATTYYDFILDVVNVLGLDASLVKPDGNEVGWPNNSTLSLERLKNSGYPIVEYSVLLEKINIDWGIKS